MVKLGIDVMYATVTAAASALEPIQHCGMERAPFPPEDRSTVQYERPNPIWAEIFQDLNSRRWKPNVPTSMPLGNGTIGAPPRQRLRSEASTNP